MTAKQSNTTHVRVGVRIRPLTSKEASERGKVVVDGSAFDHTVSISKRKFTYDLVFNSNVTNPELYKNVSPPLLNAFLSGYNATVLAYGQTGSGKTYTMGSEAHGGSSTSNIHSESLTEKGGLIPRFMYEIFSSLVQRKADSEAMAISPGGGNRTGTSDCLVDFRLTASFLEVYGEDIHDLLDEDRKSLTLREDSNGEVVVLGLRSVRIMNDAEAMNVLNTGTMNRTTAATLMNHTSSRSHAVFIVNLQQTTRGAEGVDITAASRFTFVDLAGSERMKKTGAEGERAREGIKINEGLLALGNVINALADEERLAKGEKVHIPYRQSKLTRLLQDALGGNSQTLFLACVSPSDTNAGETLSTLHYANRARNIKNSPTRNVDSAAFELRRLRALSNLLRCELIKFRFSSASSNRATDPEVERMNETSFDPNDIGTIDDDLLSRNDVKAYMSLIDEKVTELSGTPSVGTFALPHVRPISAPNFSSIEPSSCSMSFHSDNQLVDSTKIAASLSGDDEEEVDSIFGINPEEDLQIVDELLGDPKFKKEDKEYQERLESMEGEIEAQEGRLLKLRENLKAYHNMKEKYDNLINEVQGLEVEKQKLAEELERVQVDPTKGCSEAITKQLEHVKSSLKRARSEMRKHQQLCREAEQEAKKCKVFELKIAEMKNAKVVLIKKQRQEAAKHKEVTTEKIKEIRSLKRKEQKANQKIAKMEAECHRSKVNMERAQAQVEKLSEKLKQTEATLIRVLAKKRNDLNRNGLGSRQGKNRDQPHNSDGSSPFAPFSEEVKSIKFLLEKTISDRVSLSKNKEKYQTKLDQHESLLVKMEEIVKMLNERRREYRTLDSNNTDDVLTEIKEHEDTIQDMQLQLELVENDLEELRVKCPFIEDSIYEEDNGDSICSDSGPAMRIIKKLEGPVLRTLLCKFLDTFFSSELDWKKTKDSLALREAEVLSCKNEIVEQQEKIGNLSRAWISAELHHTNTVEKLEKEIEDTKSELDVYISGKSKLLIELEQLRKALSWYEEASKKIKEKTSLEHIAGNSGNPNCEGISSQKNSGDDCSKRNDARSTGTSNPFLMTVDRFNEPQKEKSESKENTIGVNISNQPAQPNLSRFD